MLGHFYSSIDCFKDIGLDDFSLSEDPDTGTIAVEKRAMLGQLTQFDFCHGHEVVYFIFGALEILNAESVHRDYFDSGFVADLENLTKEQILASRLIAFSSSGIPTLANASKPRLCPSTVSIFWLLANLLFPSMTKAIC